MKKIILLAAITFCIFLGINQLQKPAKALLGLLPNGSIIDYYPAHGDQSGDTNYCTQTGTTYADGSSATTTTQINRNDGNGTVAVSGAILCTYNDGISTLGGGNIGLYNLVKLDMTSPTTTILAAKNAMSSFGASGNGDTPVGWNSQGTSGQGSDYNWKTITPLSWNGWIILPILRQGLSPGYVGADSSIIVSPDGGAHWCNVYTYASSTISTHLGVPGCDNGNWSATGDAPLAPSTLSYTNATSTMMFKDLTPYNGDTNRMGYITFFDYCQDNNCSGLPDGATSYIYGFGSNGKRNQDVLFRIPKNINSIMDVTKWQWYTCANYSVTNVCNGNSDVYWTNTLASATTVFAGDGANPYGIYTGGSFTNQYGQIFGSPIYTCAGSNCTFVETGYRDQLVGGLVNQVGIFSFPQPWGPYRFSNEQTISFAGFTQLLRYSTATTTGNSLSKTIAMIGDNYVHAPASSIYFQNFDLDLTPVSSGIPLMGNSQFRFTMSPSSNAIIRNGLWTFFDYNEQKTATLTPAMYNNDISTFYPTKQLIGCYTDGPATCGTQNAGKGIVYGNYTVDFADTGYQPRMEVRDMVPGTYNAVTSNPFTTSADPAFTATFVVKPSDISTTYQGIAEVGPADHKMIIRSSFAVSGKVGISWDYPTGQEVSAITSNVVLSNGTSTEITITKSAGAVSICGTPPCSATVHIYINGVEVGTTLSSSGTPSMQAGTLSFGNASSNHSFNGSFIVTALYTRVLSSTEIKHNYVTLKSVLLRRGITLP